MVISASQAQIIQPNPCLPALTESERNSLKTPKNGMLILNSTSGCIDLFENNTWKSFCNQQDLRGTIRYDSTRNNFQVFDGATWMPLEQYTKAVMTPSPTSSPASLTSRAAESTAHWNGEIMDTTMEVNETTPEILSETSINDCSALPTLAYAGQDVADVKSVTLTGNLPLHGIGRWLVLSGDSGVFADPESPQTAFHGRQGVTYTLQWQITTQCDTSTDEVFAQIRFPCDPEPSPSYAGSDQHHVEFCQLHANVPKRGKGQWSIVGGIGGEIKEIENPTSVFTGTPGETYVLRWVVRTKCGYTQDDVKITFKPPCRPKPSQAEAGTDQLDVLSCTLNAIKPQYGQGKWHIVSGKGGKIQLPHLYNSNFHGASEEMYVLKWVVSNECGKTEDDVRIWFRKTCPTKLIDERDGKKYRVILAGNACWMGENLNYQHAAHYCYDDYIENCNDYGALYTWEQAMDHAKKPKSQGVCPKGWHLPTDAEWDSLLAIPGSNGKPVVTKDSSDFNLVFGGTRYPNGRYFNKREYAFYWSSTSTKTGTAWNRYFHNESTTAEHYSTAVENAFSVRCIQD
jgi:uncharacterized protein (TIGR02145 family)